MLPFLYSTSYLSWPCYYPCQGQVLGELFQLIKIKLRNKIEDNWYDLMVCYTHKEIFKFIIGDFDISKQEGCNCLCQQKFSGMIASFIHIISLFEVVSCIDMKLELYEYCFFTIS
jgi:hypothetical protein